MKSTQYSFKSRFEEGIGTNPEELIGAAHAGCYTMQLSFLMSEAGYTPKDLNTEATVSFEDGAIPKIALKLEADVPNLSEDESSKLANEAKEICPASKLLKAKKELSASLS